MGFALLRHRIAASLEFAIERAPIESEDLCRKCLIATHGFEDAQDVSALHLVHRQ